MLRATATVDPRTGSISGITITDPGSGYATPLVVAISSPGITPTGEAAAHATISPGVVTDIEVAESGFGFTTPTVDIAGGGTPSTPATAQASGGVNDLTIVDGGSGLHGPTDPPLLPSRRRLLREPRCRV